MAVDPESKKAAELNWVPVDHYSVLVLDLAEAARR